MTPEQFVAMYKDREVRVNTMYGVDDPLVSDNDKQKYVGKYGVIKKVESSYYKSFVSVVIDGREQVFLPHELDLIKQVTLPLPLPG